ncbi:MAG: hypothetical protein R6V34_00390 [Bacteroidales bacterium]
MDQLINLTCPDSARSRWRGGSVNQPDMPGLSPEQVAGGYHPEYSEGSISC